MPVLYDHREARSGVPDLLAAARVPVAADQLPAGDYVLSDRLIVERKTGADLAASVKSRRLFEQVTRLVESYPSVVLLVEGDPVHISETSWRGALGRALGAGVAVMRTADAADTAGWIERLYRLEAKGPSEARGRPKPRRATDDHAGVAQDVLTCLPGVSTIGARRLLDHFGSLAAVFAADEQQLRRVTGFGPVRGAALATLFRADG